MEETRTQIKFSNPDIDGTPVPQLITLDQETPIEGTTKKEDGSEFTWHKWLCAGDKYFMASDALDGMLKLIPEKTGKVIKIEKVENPKGGHPFFQVNSMNKDQIIAQYNAGVVVANSPDVADNAISRLEQKIDRVIELLDPTIQEEEPIQEEKPVEVDIPF